MAATEAVGADHNSARGRLCLDRGAPTESREWNLARYLATADQLSQSFEGAWRGKELRPWNKSLSSPGNSWNGASPKSFALLISFGRGRATSLSEWRTCRGKIGRSGSRCCSAW